MKRWEILLFHILTIAVAVSGLMFFWMKYLMEIDDPFSIVNHPWQSGMLSVHVIVAPVLVFVTGLLGRAMGGGRFAVGLAATASIVAGQVLASSSIWSMNIFDLLLVALAMLWLVRLINTDNPGFWIASGTSL